MTFVLDCSVTVAWLFEDEATPAVDALQDRLKEGEALVPGLWRLEVGNVLAQAERRSGSRLLRRRRTSSFWTASRLRPTPRRTAVRSARSCR